MLVALWLSLNPAQCLAVLENNGIHLASHVRIRSSPLTGCFHRSDKPMDIVVAPWLLPNILVESRDSSLSALSLASKELCNPSRRFTSSYSDWMGIIYRTLCNLPYRGRLLLGIDVDPHVDQVEQRRAIRFQATEPSQSGTLDRPRADRDYSHNFIQPQFHYLPPTPGGMDDALRAIALPARLIEGLSCQCQLVDREQNRIRTLMSYFCSSTRL